MEKPRDSPIRKPKASPTSLKRSQPTIQPRRGKPPEILAVSSTRQPCTGVVWCLPMGGGHVPPRTTPRTTSLPTHLPSVDHIPVCRLFPSSSSLLEHSHKGPWLPGPSATARPLPTSLPLVPNGSSGPHGPHPHGRPPPTPHQSPSVTSASTPSTTQSLNDTALLPASRLFNRLTNMH